MKIAVVGAGINGLATALCLSRQFPNSDITLTSSEWHPLTLSNHGLGMVFLRCVGMFDNDNVLGYIKETVNYCDKMDPLQRRTAGILPSEAVFLFNENSKITQANASNLKQTVFGIHDATPYERERLGFSKLNSSIKKLFKDECVDDETFQVQVGRCFVIDTNAYLPWLKNELEKLSHSDGRKRIRFNAKKLSRLSDVEPCDLIVNCSGLGAKKLADDEAVVPIRGQYLSLEAPDVKRLLVMNHTYVIPRLNDIAVGSVYQVGSTHTHVDPIDTEDLLERAEVGFPGIRSAKVLKMDVGIRPGRIGGPRVELEMKNYFGRKIPVVHNYGHGPRGIAQHWGCALKVAQLASMAVRSKL